MINLNVIQKKVKAIVPSAKEKMLIIAKAELLKEGSEIEEDGILILTLKTFAKDTVTGIRKDLRKESVFMNDEVRKYFTNAGINTEFIETEFQGNQKTALHISNDEIERNGLNKIIIST